MLDLRTERPECGLEIGKTYLSKRSQPWDWFGEQRWWEVFTTVTGLNGGGGYWVREEWRWNNSTTTTSTHVRTLSLRQSRELEAAITALNGQAVDPRETYDAHEGDAGFHTPARFR